MRNPDLRRAAASMRVVKLGTRKQAHETRCQMTTPEPDDADDATMPVSPGKLLALPGDRARRRWSWFGIACAAVVLIAGAWLTIDYLSEMPRHPPGWGEMGR